MSGRFLRLGLAAWAILLPALLVPPILAARRAPPGHFYLGASFYADDYLQYLSFAEQAERGSLVFLNKFDPAPQRPVLVNLEWGLLGLLSRWLGPEWAFRAIGALALLALSCAAALVLVTAGLDSRRLYLGLALVLGGEGLGWARLAAGAPASQVPDLLMGLYPWHQSLSNPHFLVGTALLAWTVVLHVRWRAGSGPRWPWLATGSALGLCRPYDLAVFVASAALATAWDARVGRSRQALLRALDLAWLLPVLLYYGVVVSHPSFGGWRTQSIDVSPPLLEFAWSLGPGLLLVLAFAGRAGFSESMLLRTLAAWCVVPLALLATWADPMAKQCATTLGTALLLLAAAVAPARFQVAGLLAGLPSAALILAAAARPGPPSYAPVAYREAAAFLRSACAPGEVAIAPTDLSLLIAARAPCQVALGHRLLTPAFDLRTELGRRFYDPATDPGWRREYLRTERARYIALPAGADAFLPGGPAVTRVLRLATFDVWRVEEAQVTMAAHGERRLRGALPAGEADPH